MPDPEHQLQELERLVQDMRNAGERLRRLLGLPPTLPLAPPQRLSTEGQHGQADELGA